MTKKQAEEVNRGTTAYINSKVAGQRITASSNLNKKLKEILKDEEK